MKRFVITFARGFGSGGKEIASLLAKDLGIHCYENRILTLASQMSGLDERLFQDVNEKVREHGGFSNFMRGLPRARSYIARTERFTSDDELFGYQCEIIRNLADQESCVIVGKCADYVLRDNPNCVNIFVYADMAFRKEQSIKKHGIDSAHAEHIITKTDKNRANYYSFYSGQKWGMAENYDLCIDSSKLDEDKIVELIAEYIQMR